MIFKEGQLDQQEKSQRRRIHLVPHPGSGNPWRQNLSGSYGPGESGKRQRNILLQKNILCNLLSLLAISYFISFK